MTKDQNFELKLVFMSMLLTLGAVFFGCMVTYSTIVDTIQHETYLSCLTMVDHPEDCEGLR